MYRMFATLEVSKLSGWLNADATCRESKGGHHTVRGEVQAGRREGGGCKQGAREGSTIDCRLGAGDWEERTVNIQSMLVTLEVSKLSGWLNADAR